LRLRLHWEQRDDFFPYLKWRATTIDGDARNGVFVSLEINGH
jgi:hypothetical protein